jgi:type 1 glutamine amidotransferase
MAAIPLSLLFTAVTVAESPRVLFLSKSSGFQHSAIAQKAGEPSHVDTVLAGVAAREGWDLVASKDAGLVSAESLREFDVVVFYTTGDLTQEGKGGGGFAGDGNPAMAAGGVEELTAWVEAGGAFLGFHSASDTFHGPDGEVSAYVDLLGGEFAGHGAQFAGKLRVVDEEHPTMAHIPQGWTVNDEWYTFKNVARDRIHVLALLETGSQRSKQKIYDRADYPVIWCGERGKGRFFYNAMGHREDVWDRETFQDAFVDAVRWAMGESPAAAPPNYGEVVDDDGASTR